MAAIEDIEDFNDGILSQETERKDSPTEKKGILYPVQQMPAWPVSFVYAFQQAVMTSSGGPLIMAYLVYNNICADDRVFFAQLVSSTIFMCGICTVIQTTIGVRLPIKQAGSWIFVGPIIVMMQTEEWKCPDMDAGNVSSPFFNSTDYEISTLHNEPAWKPRLQLINGGIVAASLFQVLLGMTGAIGFLMNYIGPLTIVPCVSMIGLALYHGLVQSASKNWGIAFMAICLLIFYANFLEDVRVPIPYWNNERGWHYVRYPFFKVYSILLTTFTSWFVCYILTVCGVFTNDPNNPGYVARTDANIAVVSKVGWFYVPYPGQWGWPTYSMAISVGMLSVTISSIVESVGDYITTARVCQEEPPPIHAINRGVMAEGLGGVICGFVGVCHNTTSYSDSPGYIAVSGMASRFTWFLVGVVFIFLGVLSKFGAALSTMPEPIIGGFMLPILGMIVPMAMANLKKVNMNKNRNLMVLGCALIFGLAIPDFVRNHPQSIVTGFIVLDQVLYQFLTGAIFMAGFVGFILDNILPGSREDRGLGVGKKETVSQESLKLYHLPIIHKFLKKYKWCSFIPISSTYKDWSSSDEKGSEEN